MFSYLQKICVLDYFKLLLFSLQFLITLSKLSPTNQRNSTSISLKHNTEEDNPNEEFDSRRIDALDGFIFKNCQFELFQINNLCTWFKFGAQTETCIRTSTFSEEFPENMSIETQNNLESSLFTNYESKIYLFLSLDEIEVVLRAVQSIKDIANYFIVKETFNVNKDGKHLLFIAREEYESLRSCKLPDIKRVYNEFDEIYNMTWKVYIFQKYIEIPLAIVVMILGLVMNGTLIFIFIKHREIIGEANMIILNISVCDFIGLVVVYPIHYTLINGINQDSELSTFYGCTMIVLSISSALSIFALSIQRLLVVLGIPFLGNNKNKYCRIMVFILFVWGPSVLMVTFIYSSPQIFNEISFFYQTIFIFGIMCFFLIVLPITVTVINVVISRKLKKSAEQIPGETVQQDRIDARNRTSRVVTFLCVIFWFTHVPVLSVSLFLLIANSGSNIGQLEYKYLSFAINSLFCLNAFLNPLTIVIMCKNFRELYAKYLLRRNV